MTKLPDMPQMTPTRWAKERAEFWRVSLRTMFRLLARKPVPPVDDIDGMIRWHAAQPWASQTRFSHAFNRRIAELRTEREAITGIPIAKDPDYAAFESSYDATLAKDADALARLKRLRDFALFKLERAQSRNDLPAVNDATNLLRHNSGIIHDEEIRAQKLNREAGETLQKKQAEQIAHALPYWILVSTDQLLADICQRVSTASTAGPLYPEGVRQLIEPALLSARLLEPMVRASQVASGMSLPKWMVDAMRAGLAATFEDADAQFDRLYATTPNAHSVDIAPLGNRHRI